ncbi:MAG: acetyl ornithine aminotransferase family protein [Anaerolineae bacterium]|jgi:4-aminobutyrate aminotransferase|nr:acetyl ornithine aminotransferase family protein [Anaerolineae bacterium]MBT7074846.1 acetyl ornithine aminotransferase family protein [Anaerolineae bacterium]MBT7782040.1 acetyl ornithine aminotransferase family protein [Anaerolineae bacterium]
MKNYPGKKANALIERDLSVVSPSYPRAFPFAMERGKGTEVWDVDGNRFLDFAAGIAVASTGHSHPKVVKAIQEQAEKFLHISSDFYHEKWIELSEKLAAIAPFEEDARVFLTNSGTEAVEAAIKLARYKTGRSGFIGFLGGFHGRTMGSLAFTASKAKYKRGFGPVMDGVVHAPFPDTYRPLLASRKGEGYGETVVRYIEEEIMGRIMPADDIAGIVIEPIQGEGGYIIPPPEFFPALRELCDKHGILLIADEVQAGMGRTGKWWSIENFGVEPDIITSAKGIASGVPLGAMIARKSVMNWTVGTHGNTYGGNPLACAAACETIDLIGESFMQNAVEVGQYALDALDEIAAHHPSIGEVRGMGLMIGVDFVKDQETREPAGAFRDRVSDLAFERGTITLGCGESTIRVSPPLNITKAEIDEGLRAFDEAIGIAEKE